MNEQHYGENPELRSQGLRKMAEVYGMEFEDGPGDFFGYTAEHLFGDIWSRPGLGTRDRRLLLLGMLAAQGATDVLGVQVDAALRNDELDSRALREIVIFLCHYAGWPVGSRVNSVVEHAIGNNN